VNILFVCSRNKWRSHTAENIYRNHADLNVRSAGTEPSARIKLSSKLIIWADLIFVMEKKHRQRIVEKFSQESDGKQIIILEIRDEYGYMDPELIEEIKVKVSAHLGDIG
jgi:predicted protein tyrosine phosphatase